MDKDFQSVNFGIGALTQLAAVGAQDEDLYDKNEENPNFKAQFKQHTHFAKSHFSYSVPNAKCGNKVRIVIPKNEDMIHKVYLKVILPEIYDGLGVNSPQDPAIYKNYLAFLLIKNVALKLNNEVVLEYTGEYLYAMYQINHKDSKYVALKEMLGIRDYDYDYEYAKQYATAREAFYQQGNSNSFGLDNFDFLFTNTEIHQLYRRAQILYIPLPLWDSNEVTQFFPCSALYNQDITLEVTFNDFNNLYITEPEYDDYISVKLDTNVNDIVSVAIGHFSELSNVYYTGLGYFIDTSGNIIDYQPDLFGVHYSKYKDASGNYVDYGYDSSGNQVFFIKDNTHGSIIPSNLSLNPIVDIDYICLSELEKRKVIQNKQEYIYTHTLIQKEQLSSNNNKIQLLFARPVISLNWFITYDEDLKNFHEPQFLKFKEGRLILGDEEGGIQTSLYDESYFRCIQNYYHSTRIPDDNRPIYTYSFALNPHSGYNNGSIHFGKTFKKVLEINGDNLAGRYITIFALCYNILDTENGYGSVRFK
jgi:hypothetical protein